jgi:hypothetical protein
MVYFGNAERVKANPFDRVAMYAVRGFNGDGSRHEQVLEAMAELGLRGGEEPIDHIDMRLMPAAEVRALGKVAGRPVVQARNGLTAEHVAQPAEAGAWPPMQAVEPQPAPAAAPGLFVQPLFQPANA